MLSRLALALSSAVGGAIVIIAAFKITWLNWAVDGPGWLVSRFISVGFHEGDGAVGFFLAIILSWLCASITIWLATWLYRRFGPSL